MFLDRVAQVLADGLAKQGHRADAVGVGECVLAVHENLGTRSLAVMRPMITIRSLRVQRLFCAGSLRAGSVRDGEKPVAHAFGSSHMGKHGKVDKSSLWLPRPGRLGPVDPR